MEYPLYCQNNLQWKNFLIPGSNFSIGNYGCNICNLAMLCKSQGKNENPLTLAPKLKYTQGLVYWQSLTDIYPEIKFVKRIDNPSSQEIRNWLIQGNIVIAKVKIQTISKKLVDHWLIFWEAVGNNDFLVGDSAKCQTGNFNDLYKGRTTIYAGAFYEIHRETKPVINNTSSELEELRKQIEIIQNQVNEIIEKINQLKGN